ncbi:MAG: branched-chain amino acid ABC transporter substrate-binding protein [Candidatus Dormiibacterota bacterium]
MDNFTVRPAWTITAAACAAFLIALPACNVVGAGPPAADTIKIGVDLPLTGPEGRAGRGALNGIRFFVHQHATLDGLSVAIDARDDTSTPTNADRGLQNLQAFIADPHVVAMIGPFDSSTARAQIPIANQARLAMVTPATSNRCLTKEPYLPAALNPRRTPISCAAAGLPSPKDLRPTGSNNYFRLSTTDELQGPAAADFASTHLHLKRVAVLSDGEAYGQALADGFIARFDKLRGTVVAAQQFDPSQSPDLTGFLQRAKNDGAQGVYFGGASADHGCAVRQQMAAVFGPGEAAPFMGGDGIALDPACLRDAGTNATGIYATVPGLDAQRIDSAQPVIRAFRTEFGRPTDYGAYTVAAYDAAGVLYSALDRAIRATGGKLPARDSVVAELATTTTFTGATGTFGFDKAGDTTLRQLSVYESPAAASKGGWTWVGSVDYSAALPY